MTYFITSLQDIVDNRVVACLLETYRERGKEFLSNYQFSIGEERSGLIPIFYTKKDGSTEQYAGRKIVCLFDTNGEDCSYFVYESAAFDTGLISFEKKNLTNDKQTAVLIASRMGTTVYNFTISFLTNRSPVGLSLAEEYARLIQEREQTKEICHDVKNKNKGRNDFIVVGTRGGRFYNTGNEQEQNGR